MADETATTVAAAASTAVTPTVHVFTDAQLQSLITSLTPGPSLPAQVGTAVKTGAEDVLANIKTLIADAENTVEKVPGAAKQFQADVKANRVQIIIGVVAVSALALQVVPMVMKVFGH